MDPLDDLGLPPPPGGEAPKTEDEPLELARPAAPPPPAQPPPRPRPSVPNSRAVVSASRLQPVPEPKGRITGEVLKEGAADIALNAASSLKDVVEDFRRSDKYFKFKALVILGWLTLAVASVVIAWPSGGGYSNSFGARLVVAGTPAEPVFMVKNDGEAPWENVEVTVNGRWHATASQIDPSREWVLSPVLLFDSDGKPAASDLKVTDIEVKVGDDSVPLYRHGAAVR